MSREAPSDSDRLVKAVRLDRTSPVPLWFQLAQQMQHLIVSGEMPAGSQLENEVLLGERLKVSRPTIRRAMEHLVDGGLVVRRRGIGTRVVQPKVRRPLALSSLYDDLRDSGQEPGTQVLASDTVAADRVVADALEVDEGDDVVRLVRLRTAGGQPIARLTNYLPTDRFEVDVDAIGETGLYEHLRSQGVVLHAATQSIGARTATAAEARALAERRGAALLTMQRTAYDDAGVPIEYGTHLYAASRYNFEVQLLANASAPREP